jgi:GT2 family glycosyltransferase
MKPKLSVTIVNYNQKYFPRLCVESLRKSDFPGEFEVIFCDNNSRDHSIDYLRKADKEGALKLVEAGANLGYGAGNNLAAEKAKGEYVLILNADITVEKDTLKKCVQYMDKRDDVGILAAKLVYDNGEVQPSCRRDFKLFDLFIKRTPLRKWPFAKRYRKYVMADFDHEKTQEVDLVTGAFMMMPRSVFKKVGGFDERYFLFMEDFDLCKKVREAGKKIVYYPKAKATHYHKRLSDGAFWRLLFKKISWLHLWSAVKYFWKWR